MTQTNHTRLRAATRPKTTKTKIKALADVVPSGTIVAWWAGSAVPVPAGWAICDGTNGTPDLRGQFLMGSPPAELGDAGGASIHNHAIGVLYGTTNSTVDLAFNVTTQNAFSNSDGWAWGKNGDRNISPQATGLAHTHDISTTITIPILQVVVGSASQATREASSLPPYRKVVFIMKL